MRLASSPPPPSNREAERRRCAVNLKAFDSRFFRTCCRRLESVVMLRPSSVSSVTSNDSCLRLRLVAERPRDGVEQIGKEDFLRFDRDRAGLDLRQIENVADQIEQIGAGAVNGAGEFDLLWRKIAVPGCRRAAGPGSGSS